MENKDLISIIIPVYNVELYLEKCLDSIINQTYKNIEILLVDDGSKDNSGKMCDEYAKKDNRIKVIHKENGGLSSARNCGIKNSNGKYLTFVDSDDIIELDMIESLYHLMNKYDSEIVISNIKNVFDGIIKKEKETDEIKVLNNIEVLEEMLYGDAYYISACGKLFKKELFENVEFPLNKVYEDVGTMYKLYDLSNKIVCSYNFKYYYMIRDGSITNKPFSNREYDLIEMTDNMCEYIKNKYPQLLDAVNYRKIFSRISLVCRKNYPYSSNDENFKLIKNNKNVILKNKKSPLRTKIAVRLISINVKLFMRVWKLYCKITSRKR